MFSFEIPCTHVDPFVYYRHETQMRIGYGFNRASADFAKAKVEDLYIDTRDTDRGERADMLISGRLRRGDTLVLLAPGDLGRGAELRPLRILLAERGVTVEVQIEDSRPRGRPNEFEPDPDQNKRIRKLWYAIGVYQLKHVMRRVEQIYGGPVSRNQLDRRYGPRDGSMPNGRR